MALVALAGSVAAVAFTVPSTVLAIAAMVMTLSLTLAAIAKGTRRGSGRWGRSVVGVEHQWGRRGRVGAEREFLQD
jgi:hypothetical protein